MDRIGGDGARGVSMRDDITRARNALLHAHIKQHIYPLAERRVARWHHQLNLSIVINGKYGIESVLIAWHAGSD